MYPLLLGRFDSLFVVWGAAVLCGMVLAFMLASRDGHDPDRAFLAVVLIAFVFVLGTKIHFWWANRDLVQQAGGMTHLLLYGFHFPGGIVLTVVAAPLLLRAVGLQPFAFFDSIAPAVGLAIAVARLGCFANGCCFGYVSHAPWALSFPVGSRAFAHHLEHGLVGSEATYSQPVLPLSLFFSIAALLIGVALWRWRPHRQFVGQLALGFVAMWSTSNVAIEYWRDPIMVPGSPHLWTLSLAIAALSVPALLLLSYRFRGRSMPLR